MYIAAVAQDIVNYYDSTLLIIATHIYIPPAETFLPYHQSWTYSVNNDPYYWLQERLGWDPLQRYISDSNITQKKKLNFNKNSFKK